MTSHANEYARAFIVKARALLGGEYLPKIERCLAELNDEEIWCRANPDSNSIGNLLLHLAGNARQWIVSGIGGAPDGRARDEEFNAREGISRAELLSGLKRVLREVDGVLAGLDHSLLLEERHIQGRDVLLLDAVFHVVEHFAMHTGQIILLTKIAKGTDLKFYDFTNGRPEHGWKRTTDDNP